MEATREEVNTMDDGQIDTPIEDTLIDIEWQGMVDQSK